MREINYTYEIPHFQETEYIKSIKIKYTKYKQKDGVLIGKLLHFLNKEFPNGISLEFNHNEYFIQIDINGLIGLCNDGKGENEMINNQILEILIRKSIYSIIEIIIYGENDVKERSK